MKRMHVHVSVANVPEAIGFYTALFATQPAVVKPDYAKWMLDDPRVNFAISMRGRAPGLDHLGIQVENGNELGEVYARLDQAGGAVIEQGETSCCYAKSEKSWIADPAGIQWETFLTTGEEARNLSGDGNRRARPGAPRFAPSGRVRHFNRPPAASSCCPPQPVLRFPRAAHCGDLAPGPERHRPPSLGRRAAHCPAHENVPRPVAPSLRTGLPVFREGSSYIVWRWRLLR